MGKFLEVEIEGCLSMEDAQRKAKEMLPDLEIDTNPEAVVRVEVYDAIEPGEIPDALPALDSAMAQLAGMDPQPLREDMPKRIHDLYAQLDTKPESGLYGVAQRWKKSLVEDLKVTPDQAEDLIVEMLADLSAKGKLLRPIAFLQAVFQAKLRRAKELGGR